MIREEITIVAGNARLKADLVIPENAIGLVIFSHGSGSSRLSPRNKFVSGLIQQKGMATLLTDLLTEEEDRIYQTRFNIDLLGSRLIAITQWIRSYKFTRNLSIGYFGASTGAASALKAAATLGNTISCIVSRGGRPDLALDVLDQVKSATLLIVGGMDLEVLELNRQAYDHLRAPKQLHIIPGASHLFEEPGKLAEAATLATAWFQKYFEEKIAEQIAV